MSEPPPPGVIELAPMLSSSFPISTARAIAAEEVPGTTGAAGSDGSRQEATPILVRGGRALRVLLSSVYGAMSRANSAYENLDESLSERRAVHLAVREAAGDGGDADARAVALSWACHARERGRPAAVVQRAGR